MVAWRSVVVVLGLAVGAVGCGASPSAGPDAPESSGSFAPDFELDTLDGKSVRLSDHLGKDVILLDFWATFCDPCLAAMPHLEQVYQARRAQGLVVLGISIDGPQSMAAVRGEVQKLGLSFPILLDQESRVVALYNPRTSAPYSVLIGRDGRIIKKKDGYVTGDAATLERDLDAALAR